jgi:CBS domain-containing membrane protein
MKRNEKISSIMTTDLVTSHINQPLSEISAAMAEGGFHHMLIVNGTKLAGLISSTDLLKVSYQYGQDPRQTDAVLDHTVSVSALMTTELQTIGRNQTIRDAVTIFAEGKIHSLPVVDDDSTLVGLVTTTDALRYLRDQY